MARRVRIPFTGLYIEAPTPGSSYQAPQTPPTGPPRGELRALYTEPAGSGPDQQGTRVGTPQIGTEGGPKQPPPRTQFGGNVEVPTTQSTISQVKGWPPNPAQAILAPAGSRDDQIKTDYELNIGPRPNKILRQLFARCHGYINGELMNSFPYNAEWSLIPHQAIPREAQQSGPNARTYDDNAPILAVYAGNPRP